MKKLATLLLSCTVFAALPSLAAMPGDVIRDFKAQDQDGKSRQLYSGATSKAIVVMIQGNGCPIVRQALPTLADIRQRYQAQNVDFLLLNSNIQDTAESVAAETKEFKINFPVLIDNKQTIGEALGVVRTSEVFVIDPKTKKLVYRGPMDDRLSYERQRPAEKHYLTDALDSMLAGKPVTVSSAEGVGCLVNFPDRKKNPLSHDHT